MSTKNALALLKIEATAGTDVVPAVADAIEVETLEVSEEIQMIERKVFRGSYGNRLPIAGNKTASASITARLRGSGVAAQEPKWMRVMQIGGCTTTVTTDAACTGEPSGKTASMYIYRNGKLHELIGCAASDISIVQDGNGFIMSATIKGKYVAVTQTAQPASPVYDSGKFYNGLAPSFVYSGHSPKLRAFTFNVNGEMSEHVNLNDASGFDYFEIQDINPGGSITVEDETISAKDWRALATAEEPAAAEAMAFNFGTGAGNLFDFAVPSCRLGSPAEGDEAGIATLELPFYVEALTPGAALFTITTS